MQTASVPTQSKCLLLPATDMQFFFPTSKSNCVADVTLNVSMIVKKMDGLMIKRCNDIFIIITGGFPMNVNEQSN